MQETVESVREHGVLMPGIARPRAEGGYEIIFRGYLPYIANMMIT